MTEIAKIFAKKITPHFDTFSCAGLIFLLSLKTILSTQISWPNGSLKILAPRGRLGSFAHKNVPFLREGSSITSAHLGLSLSDLASLSKMLCICSLPCEFLASSTA